jgi:ketosteroid isomerase-like protein
MIPMPSASLALILSAAVAGVGGSTGRDAREFARAFDHAQLVCDLKAIDEMVAEDLVYVRGSGQVGGKSEFLAEYSEPGLKLEPFTILQPTYRQLGDDAAVVGGEVVLRGSVNGEPFTSHFRYSDTFVWRDGRWRAIHIQVTRMEAAAPAA